MSGPWHPTGHARVSQRKPEAQGVCDRCYMNYSLRDLRWQYEWEGVKLQNLRLLVCNTCLDTPQPALKTIVIPPDPLPVYNPRPENYAATVPSYLETETGSTLLTEDGSAILWESEDTPIPDPNNPALYPST